MEAIETGLPKYPEKNGAVVLGGDYRALTVVRSLGRHGIPVWVLPEQQQIAAKSRYALKQIPMPRADEAEQIDFLLGMAERKRLEGWILFPTEDSHAAMLARHRTLLASRYRLITSPWDTVEIAYDKRATYRVAARLGIACPVTHYPKNRKDLESLEVSFPVILKPAIKEDVNRLTRQKAWRIDDRASLLAHYDAACRLIDADLVMLQELIPGGGEAQFSYGALCIDGQPLASIVARRSRQYPVDFGRSSSFVETVSAPEVEEIARRMLRSINYTGLIEAEFKYDARDRRYKLLDLNARVWGWHTLAMAQGLDFPYFVWRLAQQLEIPEIRVSPGYRWVRMSTDILAAAREIVDRQLSVSSYLRSLRSPLQHAIFAADDPIPFFLEIPMVSGVKLFERLSEITGRARAERAQPTGGHEASSKRDTEKFSTRSKVRDLHREDPAKLFLPRCLCESDLKQALDLLQTANIAVRKGEIARVYEQVAGGVIELASGDDAAKAFALMAKAAFKGSISRSASVQAESVPDPIVTAQSMKGLPRAS